MIDPGNKILTVQQQCSLIKLSRSSYYYHPLGITDEELEIMNRINKIYTDYSFYGVRKITEELRRHESIYNHKRIYRLMNLVGIEAIRPRRNLNKPNNDHLTYPIYSEM